MSSVYCIVLRPFFLSVKMATTKKTISEKTEIVERTELPDGTVKTKILIKQVDHAGRRITERIIRTEKPPAKISEETEGKHENDENNWEVNDDQWEDIEEEEEVEEIKLASKIKKG